MTAPAFTQRVLDILGENKEGIAQAVRTASEARSKLMELLKVAELDREAFPLLGEGKSITPTSEVRYLIDLFDAYIDGGSDVNERRKRMELFADNYQLHPSNVNKVLEYFGLEI